MPYIRWLAELGMSDLDWAGEKACRLGELTRAGLSIPSACVVGSNAYRDTFHSNQLNEKIEEILKAIDINDPAQLEQATGQIRDWIMNGPISSEIEGEILEALKRLNSPLISVRVSRVSEDVPNPSASGTEQAYLATPVSAAFDRIRKCWAAPWNSRAIYFRHRKKIPPQDVSMAVMLQAMINAEAAGVLFTASPMNRNADELHIDATWGLGEAVVAARWRPDHFVLNKKTGAVIERSIASKTVMDVANMEGGVQTVSVEEDLQSCSCLDDEALAQLAALGKKVEEKFTVPQDIEWCRVGNGIFLLQTRGLSR